MILRKKEYETAKRITPEELDASKICMSGVAVTPGEKNVVCWYVLADETAPTKPSNDVLYIVSDYAAKTERRKNENGTYAYGYRVPATIITYGAITEPAGEIIAPAATIANTVWDGNGYTVYA